MIEIRREPTAFRPDKGTELFSDALEMWARRNSIGGYSFEEVDLIKRLGGIYREQAPN